MGKRRALLMILIIGIFVYLSSWFLYNPALPILQLGASGTIAFLSASFGMLLGSIGADIIDYDELQSGQRREGAFTACGSWITKVGFALGTGLSGIVLNMTGFEYKGSVTMNRGRLDPKHTTAVFNFILVN